MNDLVLFVMSGWSLAAAAGSAIVAIVIVLPMILVHHFTMKSLIRKEMKNGRRK